MTNLMLCETDEQQLWVIDWILPTFVCIHVSDGDTLRQLDKNWHSSELKIVSNSLTNKLWQVLWMDEDDFTVKIMNIDHVDIRLDFKYMYTHQEKGWGILLDYAANKRQVLNGIRLV